MTQNRFKTSLLGDFRGALGRSVDLDQLSFATTWVKLEGIEPERERQIVLHSITYMWNIFLKVELIETE